MIKLAHPKNDPNKSYLVIFHTQETREHQLLEPCECNHKNAWLGKGYYFWLEEEFARAWGLNSKLSKTGEYSIYKAYIDCSLIYNAGDNYIGETKDFSLKKDRILDATFSQRGYFLFKDYIEEAIKHIKKVSGRSLTLQEVHRYLADKVWPELGIKGIIYDDLPKNQKHSKIPPLFYKKRIQLVIFDLDLVKGFKIYLDNQKQ